MWEQMQGWFACHQMVLRLPASSGDPSPSKLHAGRKTSQCSCTPPLSAAELVWPWQRCLVLAAVYLGRRLDPLSWQSTNSETTGPCWNIPSGLELTLHDPPQNQFQTWVRGFHSLFATCAIQDFECAEHAVPRGIAWHRVIGHPGPNEASHKIILKKVVPNTIVKQRPVCLLHMHYLARNFTRCQIDNKFHQRCKKKGCQKMRCHAVPQGAMRLPCGGSTTFLPPFEQWLACSMWRRMKWGLCWQAPCTWLGPKRCPGKAQALPHQAWEGQAFQGLILFRR